MLILARVTLLFWPEIIQFSLSRDYYYVCLFGQKLKIRGGEDVEQIINLERPNHNR